MFKRVAVGSGSWVGLYKVTWFNVSVSVTRFNVSVTRFNVSVSVTWFNVSVSVSKVEPLTVNNITTV